MQVRRATMSDIVSMQQANVRCLPENYDMRYYFYHMVSWPEVLYVCEDVNERIVGYVMAKLDDEEDMEKRHGHITSLAVLRTHRKLGIATQCMQAALDVMKRECGAHYCSLHVRRSNDAGRHLYQESLGFRTQSVDEKYYVDDEDAFHMKCYFTICKERTAYVENDGSLTWTNPPPDEAKEKEKEAKKAKKGKGAAVDIDAAAKALEEDLLLDEGSKGKKQKGGHAKGGKNGKKK